MKLLPLLLFAIIFSAGCSREQVVPGPLPRLESLAGTSWELTEYYDMGRPAWTAASRETLTLGYSFTGSAAVSTEYTPGNGRKDFTTPYLYSGGDITFDPGTTVAVGVRVISADAEGMEWEYSMFGNPVSGLRFRRIR